jgi:2,3-bisphosphoglycerate-independent phosphoglycerate mutase
VKYVVCVPDGCADEPLPELGGEVGRAAVIPEGLPPGSDVGNMSILGYDPAEFHTGRAPIEAAALGLRLRADQVAYRCNLVNIGEDGTMLDFAGGHPSTEDATKVIEELQAELGTDEVSFHPGFQYRHIVVVPKDWADAECTPPHDLSDKPAVFPTGPSAPKLQALMDASCEIVGRSPLAASQIWLWGQGPQPQMTPFKEAYGLDAALCTAVDLIRGLGVLTDIDVIEVEGATGWFDTNYEGKRDAALDALRGGKDLFLIHVEATDEAGHAGNVEEKVKALENWDSRILAPLVEGLDAIGPWRLLLLPDHATPTALKTHTTDSVPWLLVDSEVDGPGGEYTEVATAGASPVPGHALMSKLVGTSR